MELMRVIAGAFKSCLLLLSILLIACQGMQRTVAPEDRISLHQGGPHNPGHEELECGECHSPAAGYFGYGPTGNDQCLSCHDNPGDRHPVARFKEPEFAQARQVAGVDSCIGCHQQHQASRVTASMLACQYCHQDTAMDNDPVDVPHSSLVEQSRWDTCLACHDFHGNHDFKPPTMMVNRLSEQEILRYFQAGESPYGYRSLTVMQTMRKQP